MTNEASAPSPAIRLLLVDDHQVVRLGLKTLFGSYPQIKVVGEAGGVAEAIATLPTLLPDVVLLDIRLPDGTGFEISRFIQKSQLKSRVLVLTSVADDQFIFDAISSGADGYLLKDIDPAGLVHAIEQVATGQSVLNPGVTARVLNRVRRAADGTLDKLSSLSPQEHRVVSLVAEGKTNKQIATSMGLSDKTVKNYLSNVFEKLQLTRRSQAAVLFTQQGH